MLMFCFSNVSYLSGNAVVLLSKLGQSQMAAFPSRPSVFKTCYTTINDNHVLTVKGGDFRVKLWTSFLWVPMIAIFLFFFQCSKLCWITTFWNMVFQSKYLVAPMFLLVSLGLRSMIIFFIDVHFTESHILGIHTKMATTRRQAGKYHVTSFIYQPMTWGCHYVSFYL